MKKKYEKPEILIENFELTQHIAACGPQTDAKHSFDLTPSGECSMKVYFGTKEACYAGDNIPTTNQDQWPKGITCFSEGNKACKTGLNGYCYTEGAAALKIFGS